MGKLDDKRAEQDAEIIRSCEAGIGAVLSDPVVMLAEQLLDEVAAELIARPDPMDPLVSLRSQVLRSVSSIAANVAEGVGNANTGNVRRFYLIARGSAYESVIWLKALQKKTQLDLCLRLCVLIDAEVIRLTQKPEPEALRAGPVNTADNQDADASPVASVSDPWTPNGPGVRS